MLPRKSAVLRYLVFAVISVIGFLWLVSDNHFRRSDSVDVLDDELTSANESELFQEFHKMRLEYGTDGLSLFSLPSSRNYSLSELRLQVFRMRLNRPKNPHPFHYTMNPSSMCSGDIFLLVYVHSAPAHFKQRMSIRETWGNVKNFQDIVIKVIFLCGMIPTDEGRSVQDALLLESDMYGDIAQEDFVDSYRNLTYKAIMGLKWVSSYCMHAKFLLKSDDDIFVNIFSLVRHLQQISVERKKLLLCLVWYQMKVMRNPRSKWYLSPTEYPSDYFPTYCSGSAFIMSPDVASAMFNASFRIPFFWVDDFYVTGLLAEEVGVTHQNFNSVYMLTPRAFLQKFTEPNVSLTLVIGHVHSLNSLKIVWNSVLAQERGRKTNVTTTKTRILSSHS